MCGKKQVLTETLVEEHLHVTFKDKAQPMSSFPLVFLGKLIPL